MTTHIPHTVSEASRTNGLLKALADRLASGRYDNVFDTDISIDELADRMVAAVPTRLHESDAALGPFFDSTTLATWRGVSRQAIQKSTHRHDILGLKIGDGSFIFPSFQFGTKGELLPHMREVLGLIDPDWVSPWDSARWLNTPDEAFGDTTAAVALRTGRSVAVLKMAQKVHRSWVS